MSLLGMVPPAEEHILYAHRIEHRSDVYKPRWQEDHGSVVIGEKFNQKSRGMNRTFGGAGYRIPGR